MMIRVAFLLFSIVCFAGCGYRTSARVAAYQAKEASCIKQYADGDIEVAKRALFEFLNLTDEEEQAHLPSPAGALETSRWLAKARLSLIYQQIGSEKTADRYLHESVSHCRNSYQLKGQRLDKSDKELELEVIRAVNKLDENLHPRWRQNTK